MKEQERNADQRAAVIEASVISRAMHGQKRLQKETQDSKKSEDAGIVVVLVARLLSLVRGLHSKVTPVQQL